MIGSRGQVAACVVFSVTVCCSYLKSASERSGAGSTPVILITVDTLRADHLGCYSPAKHLTPHIDTLTQGGALFLQSISPAPLTLPSHTSLLTSTHPFWNGVEENGEKVPPGTLTLAAILKSHGYRTAAFVGGFVLDRRFGLAQGFDFYDSPFNVQPQPESEAVNLKRDGSDVIRASENWLDVNAEDSFFVFIHLFDLHRPYTLPAAKSEQDAVGYGEELRSVDQALGKFWKYLADKGLFDKSLIVLTSDHGESLGEHGEETHGYFIYESTLRVPLIFHWPAGHTALSLQAAEPVGLIDVAPTVLQFLGIPLPSRFQGRSLLPLLEKKHSTTPDKIYSESLYARDHFAWAPLKSLRVGDYKYISAPKPELYDLALDPGEIHNLIQLQMPRASDMAAQLHALEAQYAPPKVSRPARPSPQELDLLASLGYTEVVHGESGADPKDKLAEYQQYQEAIQLASLGRYSEAARVLRTVLSGDSGNIQAHFNLAVCDFKTANQEEAIKELHSTLSLAPEFVRAEELLGTIWLQKREYAQARQEYEKLLAILPGDYGAHYNLGVLDMMENRFDSALDHFKKAGRAAPQSALVHGGMGQIYLRQNRLREAQQEFSEEVRLTPNSSVAHYHLGLVFQREKLEPEAATQFRDALAHNPDYQPAREALRELAGR